MFKLARVPPGLWYPILSNLPSPVTGTAANPVSDIFKDKSMISSLKTLGAEWNRNLKGWVLPETARGAVAKLSAGEEISAEEMKEGGVQDPESSVDAHCTIHILHYKKAILAKGDTKPVMDVIKALGGKWLKGQGAWMFAGGRKEVVVRVLKKDLTNTIEVFEEGETGMESEGGGKGEKKKGETKKKKRPAKAVFSDDENDDDDDDDASSDNSAPQDAPRNASLSLDDDDALMLAEGRRFAGDAGRGSGRKRAKVSYCEDDEVEKAAMREQPTQPRTNPNPIKRDPELGPLLDVPANFEPTGWGEAVYKALKNGDPAAWERRYNTWAAGASVYEMNTFATTTYGETKPVLARTIVANVLEAMVQGLTVDVVSTSRRALSAFQSLAAARTINTPPAAPVGEGGR